MIESLLMPKIPFANCEMIQLDKYNFLFGNNGTGKSSIARMIYRESITGTFSNLVVNSDAEILVYDKEFSRRIFADKTRVPGVFMLGEDASKIENEINETERIVKEIDKRLKGYELSKIELQDEIYTNEVSFFETCWETAEKQRKKFNSALDGKKQKASFANYCLVSYTGEPSAITEDQLSSDIERIFTSSLEQMDTYKYVPQNDLFDVEKDSIFRKVLVGDENIEFGELIKTLSNSDWVHNGLKYIEKQRDVCPFCQQTITSELVDRIHSVFNAQYEKDISTLKNISIRYQTLTDDIANHIYYVLQERIIGYNYAEITAQYDLMKLTIGNNLQRIEEKMNEPSKIIEIDSLVEIINQIDEGIEDLNRIIAENNQIVKNKKNEQILLSKRTTDYISNNVLHAVIREYKERAEKKQNGIKNLDEKINEESKELRRVNKEISDLKNSVSSIDRTLDFIQKTMNAIGFSNFKIVASQDGKGFRIIRLDGTCVEDTLSEGEYGFVTFLYFYYLVVGSNSTNPNNRKKIVVIDDPISSLDSNGLFYVTGLIDQIIRNHISKNSTVEQLIVFTHNTYFLKQLIELTKSIKPDKPKFFLIEKDDVSSAIKVVNRKQFESSYESLWRLVLLADGSSSQLVLNAMRRIIDDFIFKYLGKNKYDLCNELPQEDQALYRSLLAITNAGSHDVPDDFSFCSCGLDIKGYHKVFKEIFVATGFEKHYEQMLEKIAEQEQNTI